MEIDLSSEMWNFQKHSSWFKHGITGAELIVFAKETFTCCLKWNKTPVRNYCRNMSTKFGRLEVILVAENKAAKLDGWLIHGDSGAYHWREEARMKSGWWRIDSWCFRNMDATVQLLHSLGWSFRGTVKEDYPWICSRSDYIFLGRKGVVFKQLQP